VKFLAFFLFFTISLAAYSQQDSIDYTIGKYMKQQRIVGVAVGIIKEGRIIKMKGYGYSNLEHLVPVTEKTVFKLASISKQMIAACIIKLVQEDKLKLTDSITKFFSGAPAIWNKIIIRHLLNHTSGLQRESPAFQPMKIQSDSFLITASYKDTLRFAPGTKWQYCNLGYIMLADIIRQISGKPYQQFMREDIFLKQGLSNTQAISLSAIIPERADGYILYGRDSILNEENYIALRPSGAFQSTITDMLKWEMLIQNNQLLSKANWQLMYSDTEKTNLPFVEGSPVFYGYGWNVCTYRNKILVFHAGSLNGFRTIYYRFPSEKTAIVILANSEPSDLAPLAQSLARLLFIE